MLDRFTTCVVAAFAAGMLAPAVLPFPARADSAPDKGVQKGEGKADVSSFLQTRVVRWHMKFNTLNGEDYRKQLADLGAILAVPDGKGEYFVIRDLNKLPAKGKKEDLTKIKRIF